MVDKAKLDQMLSNLRTYIGVLRRLAAVPGETFLGDHDKIGNAKYHLLIAIECCVDIANHVTLNDDDGAAHQFHPTLSVESNGAGGDKVTVTFYDRRQDAANCLSHVYATQSSDSGATWSGNVRLTTVAQASTETRTDQATTRPRRLSAASSPSGRMRSTMARAGYSVSTRRRASAALPAAPTA